MQKKTHRCKELLEYNKNTYKPCAIRYDKWFPFDNDKTWILSSLKSDTEWLTEYMVNIAKIKYCCFCGEKLNDK